MKKIFTILALLLSLCGLAFADTAVLEPDVKSSTSNSAKSNHFDYSAYSAVNPLDVVARPNFYLNKNISVKGKFDKFSTLGLDYEPAMRSSDNYITFLIQRPDVKDHNLPLSEMKCFLSREDAEKYIELNSGDKVEFWGTVFSNALGDVWVDVKKFNAVDKNTSAAQK